MAFVEAAEVAEVAELPSSWETFLTLDGTPLAGLLRDWHYVAEYAAVPPIFPWKPCESPCNGE
ncbi:hypothetical protein [Tropicimonas sp. IMCC34043]|uniref:hypothetical protein n=1 Tax=Tropicimonas sp. IMCC34043 TaxID=2248760 RepID=UPI001300180D|nr:hypothetical protein [Tropicimonas sp. IMCC34043]